MGSVSVPPPRGTGGRAGLGGGRSPPRWTRDPRSGAGTDRKTTDRSARGGRRVIRPPYTTGDAAPRPPGSMVRSLAKGQFHVTSAWGETALALEPTFLEPPLLEEEGGDDFPGIPDVESSEGVEPPTEGPMPEAPEREPAPIEPERFPDLGSPDDRYPASPPVELPAPVAAPAEPESPPPSTPEEERKEAPPSPAPRSDPSRVLVSLLARMWLMRSNLTPAGGVALPSAPPLPAPVPPAPALPAEPAPDHPAVEPGPPPPAGGPSSSELTPGPPSPDVPSLAHDHVAPALPSLPAEEPPRPATPLPTLPVSGPPPGPPLEPAPRLPYEPRPGDVDDRRPVSGVASFLVEVAAASHPALAPPPAVPSPAMTTPPPTAPPPVPFPRPRMVYQILHCPHPIPERPASRSSCRQHRVEI